MACAEGAAGTFAQHLIMQRFVVFDTQACEVLSQAFVVITARVKILLIASDTRYVHITLDTGLHHIGWFFEVVIAFGVASGTKAVLV